MKLHKKAYFHSIGLLMSISACSSNTLAPYDEKSTNVPVHPIDSPQVALTSVEKTEPQTPVDIDVTENVFPNARELSSEHLEQGLSQNNNHENSISPTTLMQPPSVTDTYICHEAQLYFGKSIGDGECVDLIKHCTGAPLTRFWKPGDFVFGSNIEPGTAIATFKNGKYPNITGYHAAIYSHQDENGIYAWDQWKGMNVHLRYIKANRKNKPGNNALKYQVIRR